MRSMRISSSTHIVLATAWGEGYGTGHVQRMATLLSVFTEQYKLRTSLVCESVPPFLPKAFHTYCVQEIPPDATLIIRDMRDSSSAQIEALRKKAPVIVLDDLGEGRSRADKAIDLLPVPERRQVPDPRAEPFLYGYNFYSALYGYKGTNVTEHFDLCIYPGHQSLPGYTEKLVSLLSPHCTLLFLCNNNAFSVVHGKRAACTLSPLQALLASKALLSHFGLMLYEGSLCGCSLYALNPTSYHARLASFMQGALALTNLGVYPDIDWQKLATRAALLARREVRTIPIDRIIATVEERIERFVSLLHTYIAL
jgi:hypothetical protein